MKPKIQVKKAQKGSYSNASFKHLFHSGIIYTHLLGPLAFQQLLFLTPPSKNGKI